MPSVTSFSIVFPKIVILHFEEILLKVISSLFALFCVEKRRKIAGSLESGEL